MYFGESYFGESAEFDGMGELADAGTTACPEGDLRCPEGDCRRGASAACDVAVGEAAGLEGRLALTPCRCIEQPVNARTDKSSGMVSREFFMANRRLPWWVGRLLCVFVWIQSAPPFESAKSPRLIGENPEIREKK